MPYIIKNNIAIKVLSKPVGVTFTSVTPSIVVNKHKQKGGDNAVIDDLYEAEVIDLISANGNPQNPSNVDIKFKVRVVKYSLDGDFAPTKSGSGVTFFTVEWSAECELSSKDLDAPNRRLELFSKRGTIPVYQSPKINATIKAAVIKFCASEIESD